MNKEITELLDKLEKLVNKATEGPWYAYKGQDYSEVSLTAGSTPRMEKPLAMVGSKHADAKFIAAAREAIPKLIRCIRGLDEEVESMSYSLAYYTHHCPRMEFQELTDEAKYCPLAKDYDHLCTRGQRAACWRIAAEAWDNYNEY